MEKILVRKASVWTIIILFIGLSIYPVLSDPVDYGVDDITIDDVSSSLGFFEYDKAIGAYEPRNHNDNKQLIDDIVDDFVIHTSSVLDGNYRNYWSVSEVVSTESQDSSLYPSLAVDNMGTVHVCWADNTDYQGCGTDWDIFYKYRISDGVWSVTEVVSTESTSCGFYPSLAVDSFGVVHVAWQDLTDFGDGFNIFYKYRTPDGVWSVREVVSTESSGVTPSLDVDCGGVVHVAWQDASGYGGSGSDWDISYKYRTPDNGWSVTEVVSTESTSDSQNPSLAVDCGGVVHVAWDDWTDYGGSGGICDIFYKYRTSNDGWSVTEVVSTESTNASVDPLLSVDSMGTVHVAWNDLTDFGSSFNILYKYRTPDDGWSLTEVVSTEGTCFSDTASLAVDCGGVVHISWVNYSFMNFENDIFYKYRTSDDGWSITEMVTTALNFEASKHSLAVDSGGVVHVVWENYIDMGSIESDILYKYRNPVEYVLTVSVEPEQGGFANVSPDPPYYYGTVVTLTASENPGFSFSHWSGDASGSNPVTTVTMDGDKSVTAHFVEDVAIPYLSCLGSLSWADVKPGATVTGSFTIENNGDPGSLLDWEVLSYPSWGSWMFTPSSGDGLSPEDGPVIVVVEVVAPSDKNTQFSGDIIIVNSDSIDNFCRVSVSLATPVSYQSQFFVFFQKLVELFPNVFPKLQYLLGI